MAPHENRRLSHEAVHGLGETEQEHAQHAAVKPKKHWGLPSHQETLLFYFFAFTSWGLEIASAALGPYFHTWNVEFAVPFALFQFFHWSAMIQTMVGMGQRSSWVRDEADLVNRKRYLYLAVRLNRLMLPTALIALVTFIQAYARRFDLHDLAYWLLFLLTFIWNVVFSVMNAYNNITWESDRLEFEENEQPFRVARLAILGISTKVMPTKMVHRMEHDDYDYVD